MQALPYARLVARLLAARIVLVHVVLETEIRSLLKQDVGVFPYTGISYTNVWQREEEMYARMREQSEGYLHQIASDLEAEGFAVQVDVQFGAPAPCIIESASTHAATLIVMATHGYGGLRRWALGSVTDRVVQSSNMPVLVVRGHRHVLRSPATPSQLKRILVPLDGSELAEQALPLACMLAEVAHADLHLFQAVFPISGALYPSELLTSPDVEPEALLKSICRNTTTYLEYVASTLHHPCYSVSVGTTVGHPAEAILIEAEQQHADLIVMVTHGYGGIQRWALGSVADKVLRATTTPILIIRAQREEVTHALDDAIHTTA
jgi:nucleotide-binding universal stress UspA family protein